MDPLEPMPRLEWACAVAFVLLLIMFIVTIVTRF